MAPARRTKSHQRNLGLVKLVCVFLYQQPRSRVLGSTCLSDGSLFSVIRDIGIFDLKHFPSRLLIIKENAFIAFFQYYHFKNNTSRRTRVQPQFLVRFMMHNLQFSVQSFVAHWLSSCLFSFAQFCLPFLDSQLLITPLLYPFISIFKFFLQFLQNFHLKNNIVFFPQQWSFKNKIVSPAPPPQHCLFATTLSFQKQHCIFFTTLSFKNNIFTQHCHLKKKGLYFYTTHRAVVSMFVFPLLTYCGCIMLLSVQPFIFLN